MLFQKLVLTACVALAATVSTPVFAQSNVDGAIAGKAPGAGTITVEDSATGFKRTISAAADGSFRATALPPGVYSVTYTNDTGVTQSTQVSVVIGTTSTADFSDDAIALGEMKITASPVNPIDFAKVESVTIMTEKQLDVLPVARNPTAVALLAPGTVKGDTAFGNLASFGGASVAENQYYVNGMNISNFKNGLDPALIPFDAYSQFEVLTGAYSAMYGRSTGGVINATTKSGSNVYHGGVSVYFEPDFLRADSPDTYFTNSLDESEALVYNRKDEDDTLEANVWASGPVIKDKLFVYGIYNVRNRDVRNVYASTSVREDATSDDPFWLIKVDAVPFENHRIEYTGFHDSRTWTYNRQQGYDFDVDRPLGSSYLAWDIRGGSTHTGRYTGIFFDKLQVSAQLGRSEQDRSSYSEIDLQPGVYDTRPGRADWLSGNDAIQIIPESLDTRQLLRIDLEYPFEFLGTHRLKAGMDRENNKTAEVAKYTGDVYYRYFNRPAGFTYNGSTPLAVASDVVRARRYTNEGGYDVHGQAYYIEDNWSMMENRLLLRLGLRNERFENFNKDGGSFISITNQYAPRIGFTYDLFGNQRTKLSFNFGRYHLPVASNTNARLSGGEFFTEEYYLLNGIRADYTPILGAKLGGTTVFSDGSIPDPREIVDQNIKPMYQDEITLNLQHQLTKSLTVGVRTVARDLGQAMDDMIVNHALRAWATENGYDPDEVTSTNIYILGNPGRPIVTAYDFGTGLIDLTLTPEQLAFPKAIRKYYSVETYFEKVWDGKWYAQASYTWSHSYGNTEGWVLSDNGQEDAGITILYDTPDLARDSYGDLANDVRHHFKIFGSFAPTDEIQLGLNAFLKSGRPINQFVNFDDPVTGLSYGWDYFGVPRGTAGTTPWVYNIDLMFKWSPKHMPGFLNERLTIGVDIFNVLNANKATEVYENYEEFQSIGELNPRWGKATSFQAPRSVRISASVEF